MGTNTINESVSESKEHLKATLEDAKFVDKLAKNDQSVSSILKCKPHLYKPVDKYYINKSLFKDTYARAQKSCKLSARRFEPFIVMELIGKNAIRRDHVKIHYVVNIMHTVPYHSQDEESANKQPDPVPNIDGLYAFTLYAESFVVESHNHE